MEDKSHRRLKQNDFHLVDAVRVLAAVEDNKGPLTLVLCSLKLVKADGEMLSELLALGQILKQQLVVVLSGQSGGLVVAKNYRVSVGVQVPRQGTSSWPGGSQCVVGNPAT